MDHQKEEEFLDTGKSDGQKHKAFLKLYCNDINQAERSTGCKVDRPREMKTTTHTSISQRQQRSDERWVPPPKRWIEKASVTSDNVSSYHHNPDNPVGNARTNCCSVIPKIIVRVTLNGRIWKDSTGVEMHKMKGDYYRCLAEFATGETKSKAGEDACVACAEATKIAEKDLVVTHLVRLAMALSSSVFQYEVLQNPDDIAGGVHVGENDLDDVPVVTQRQIPMVQRTRTLQCMDKVVDNLVVQVPRVQVVEKTVEIPQLQTVEEPAETPQTQTIQGSQTSEYTCLSSGTGGRCGGGRDRNASSYRIRITHVRLQHQFRRLWRNWLRPPRFSLRTGFNSVLENGPSKPLLFHSMRKLLRCLSLGRKKRRNRL